MMSIVFKEQDRSGAFTGKTQQFCSNKCAEEWVQHGLAFVSYISEEATSPSPLDQCDACLVYLQAINNDRMVINIRVAGKVSPDRTDSATLVEQIRVMDFHLPGSPEAERQLRELAA